MSAMKREPTAIALTVYDEVQPTPRVDFHRTVPGHARRSSGCCRAFWRRLYQLIEFHTFNAAIGLGAGIVTWVFVPLSLVLLPFFGVGLVLFQLTVRLLVGIARVDLRLAGRVDQSDWSLNEYLEIESRVPLTERLVSFDLRVSSEVARLVFYFAAPKLLIGALSGVAAAWTLEQPLLALVSGGYNDVLGITTFEAAPKLYVALLFGCWMVGVGCAIAVPKVSIPPDRKSVM